MRSPTRRLSLVLILTLAAAASLPALSYISVEAGEMVLFNPGDEGALSPWLVTVGAAVPVVEVGVFRLEISTLLWTTQYYLGPTSGRAIPAEWEAGQFGVLGIWVAPLAGVHFPVAQGKLELGAAATLALNFRIPLFAYDPPAEDDEEAQQAWKDTWSAAATYLMGKGRFLFPEADVWIRWILSERLSLALTFKTLFPLFHAWDGDGVGIGDQLIVAAVLGFDIRIPPRRETP